MNTQMVSPYNTHKLMGMILNEDHVSMSFRGEDSRCCSLTHALGVQCFFVFVFVWPLVLVLDLNLLQSLPQLPVLFDPFMYAKFRHTFSRIPALFKQP
jgi:hypothetical protein